MSAERPSAENSHGGTEAADRVADMLVLFSRADTALGVSQIARSLKLSKAVVHRILQSLASRSIVQPAPGESAYILGPAAMGLGTRASGQMDLRAVASPVLRALRDQTRETTTLSMLTGTQRIYLDQFESPQEVKMVVSIGVRLPLHSGASSRAILAHLPQAMIDLVIGQLRAARPELDVPAFREELAATMTRGYAFSINERHTGAAALASPIFDGANNVIGSVSSSGPMFRYGDNNSAHAALVVEAASKITDRLRK